MVGFQQRGGLGAMECRSVPMQALLDRLGSGVKLQSWSCYLPAGLLPQDVWHGQASEVGSNTSRGEAYRGHLCDFGLGAFPLEGRVWSLSRDSYGCRQVQEVLEAAESDEARERLASELRGRVVLACSCPHANHVLQKIIILLRASALQFIIDELLFSDAFLKIALHKYGCRVVQRLVEHCHAQQMHPLTDGLILNFSMLARDPFGNYVAQKLLWHGTIRQRQHMVESLVEDVHLVASESCGCTVISAALTCVAAADGKVLAQRLLRAPGLMVSMAAMRYGHAAILQVLRLLDGAELAIAIHQLQSRSRTLRISRYGRIVCEHLEVRDIQLSSEAIVGGA